MQNTPSNGFLTYICIETNVQNWSILKNIFSTLLKLKNRSKIHKKNAGFIIRKEVMLNSHGIPRSTNTKSCKRGKNKEKKQKKHNFPQNCFLIRGSLYPACI